jgi:hypothetical protein
VSAAPTGALRVAIVGFFIALGAFLAILVLTFFLMGAMEEIGMADFRYSGAGWPAAAILTFEIFALPPFLIVVFCVVIPMLFDKSARTGRMIPAAVLLTVTGLAIVGVGYFALLDAKALAVIIPTLFVTLPLAALFATRLNIRLAQMPDRG